MTSSPLTEFLSGAKAELPILVGVAPFGMIYGVLALDAGIPAGMAQAMSAVVFAGSSQMILTQLVHLSVPAVVLILTVFVVNLRHALYSASLAPYMQRLPVRWKVLLSYLLTDEAYAVTIIHYEKLEALIERGEAASEALRHAHWFFLGAGLALWSTWQLSTAAGIFLGAVVPASWSLDFTLALTFIALVVPNLKDRPGVMAAVVAGAISILAYGLPYRLGLIAAALAGVAAGLWAEAQGDRFSRASNGGGQSMNWGVMVVAGLVTFLIRLSFILLIGRHEISPWLRRSLRFVPPAVLTAIILPELLINQGRLDLSFGNQRLLAGLLAGLVAWLTRSAVLTILAGMLALWLLQALL